MTTSTAADQISYPDLYARWEQGNWSATKLDFSTDRVHWERDFTELERRAALWTYSMFFHGEDSVADNLSPFIDAAPREEQKYFLATQQVDEARHAVLFARFMREVGRRDGSAGARRAHVGLPEGVRATRRMAAELARPLRPKLAQAIALITGDRGVAGQPGSTSSRRLPARPAAGFRGDRNVGRAAAHRVRRR